ncbi:cytochrome C oxidase subunit IV family protein [uncultured Sunxiuqinia sp.]|jgi:cytochrome c oxidase subunit IV|uniref:cytochrome C oxidase subunit IV family protein n=1 Tax=uncultured Sunxiuqinia sp. TaxID=1573825 RepID=UPI0019A20BCD|nr:cytochrome C oxidase subunit IV family protein [Sunxiuqinia sp.]|tara:strand:+ start:49800 stop:50084 length:285 start_codon:yes stop_codon:yes gene_type:complete
MENEKHHIVPYGLYAIILLLLLTLTFLSIAITNIELGAYTVAGALLLASVKSGLVLVYFMHLKFDKAYIQIMVGLVFLLFIAIVLVTFFDYYFR